MKRSRRIVVRGRAFLWSAKLLQDLADDQVYTNPLFGPDPSTLVVRPAERAHRVLRVHLGPSVAAWVAVTPGKVRVWVEHALGRGWPDAVDALDVDGLAVLRGAVQGGGAGGGAGEGGLPGGTFAGADEQDALPRAGRGRVDEERPA